MMLGIIDSVPDNIPAPPPGAATPVVTAAPVVPPVAAGSVTPPGTGFGAVTAPAPVTDPVEFPAENHTETGEPGTDAILLNSAIVVFNCLLYFSSTSKKITGDTIADETCEHL